MSITALPATSAMAAHPSHTRTSIPPWVRGALAFVLGSQAMLPALAAEPADPVVAEVLARDAALSAAHGRGDMTTYLQGLSRKYVYIDVAGGRVSADKLATRRGNDQLRLVSSEVSEEESVRLADNVVLLRGLERGSFTYFGGLPRQNTTRWSALWVREDDGQWRLVAETATPVTTDAGLPFMPAELPANEVRSRQGLWNLSLPQELVLRLAADGGRLIGTLEGQSLKVTFVPASPRHYFALERPFELRFGEDRNEVTLVTWGISTRGQRAK
jgi:ketosteroid isomerase-like protein